MKHTMRLQSELASGDWKMCAFTALSVKVVHVILRNDIAGGQVLPIRRVCEFISR